MKATVSNFLELPYSCESPNMAATCLEMLFQVFLMQDWRGSSLKWAEVTQTSGRKKVATFEIEGHV